MEELQQKDIRTRLEDLKSVISGFSELLLVENEALKAFDVEKVSALYEQKSKTVAAYRNMSAYFIKNHEALEQLPKADKKDLREASLRLDELIRENELLLKTRMEASRNVMNTIINIAKVTNNRNATSYGAQGRYSPLDNSKNALAINRTL